MKNFLGASHLPILSEIMDRSDGPVLEMGIGYYSTPYLYWKCKAQGRDLISLEGDKKWMDKLEMPTWKEPGFGAFHVENWDDLYDINKTPREVPYVLAHRWGVVLIDHRPAKRRRIDAKLLANNADFVIMHDSEPEIDRFYRYGYAYKHFKYRFDYKLVGKPNTTVLSNTKDLSVLSNLRDRTKIL